MQKKLICFFTNSAGVLLLAVTLAMFAANLAKSGFVKLDDPIFSISMQYVFWIVGAAALIVAMICLFGRQPWLKATLVLWLTLNLFVYWFGSQWNRANSDFSSYMINLAQAFGITSGTAYWLLEVIFLYLLVGSSIALLCLWLNRGKWLKTVCSQCGGHIEFSINQTGQYILCPHCKTAITLSKPDENLKMTCVLCGGRVEFPAHALGQKIPCPHCAKTITLLKSV